MPDRLPTPTSPTPHAQPRTWSRRRFVAGPSRTPRASEHWLRVFRHAMGGRFEVTLDDRDAHAVGPATEALGEAQRLERAWSVFDERSGISRVNRCAAGEAVAVDPELHALLLRCAALHRDTGGAFDITSTPFSRCWGFLARSPAVPAAEALAEAASCVGQHLVALDADCRSVRFERPGVGLNLGSIGKGYAVGAIAARLRAAGVRHALVSASGSSIAAVGGRGRGWAVDVRPSGCVPVARLRLRDAAMATSGAGEQFVLADGVRYGHVIDPRTGRPARGTLSATVVHDDGATADALATAGLIDGAAFAERYCAAHPRTLFLIVSDAAPERARVFGHHPSVVVEAS